MKTILSILMLAALAATAQPVVPHVAPKTNATVTLEWHANLEPEVTHYFIHRGIAPRNYTEMMRVDGRLNTNCVWTNIVIGVTNYFAATAAGTNVVESDYSNEVSVRLVRLAPPNMKTAIPITAFIESKSGEGQWVRRHTIGPIYALADDPQEIFRVVLDGPVGVPVLPK